MKTIIAALSKLYNEKIESIGTRILYFFNTIDTYFLIAGILSFVLVFPEKVNIITLALPLLFVVVTSKIADFYPTFVILSLPILVMSSILLPIPVANILLSLVVNIILFVVIQFLFMGIPNAIVARDIRVPFIMLYNSLFTVAPTTVSFSMSIFFSFYVYFCILATVSCQKTIHYIYLIIVGIILFVISLISYLTLPKNRFSKFHKPDVRDKPLFSRVIVLNIDGVRKDIFDSLNLPAMLKLTRDGTTHTLGLETVYRALTNPAFASIFTGTIPEVHHVRNNNLGQSIKTEGLPDIVPTIAYGSMHVKHFCKKSWTTRIVSLPRHSVYHSDEIMINWLKKDITTRSEVRLFVADFSEADFLGHAYGSTSKQYKKALLKIDLQIGEFIDWLKNYNLLEDTAIIVCSDHGIAAIDHSYLIANPEKYVPFLIFGKGIKKGYQIQRPGKIMDICCTIAYMLGVRYPESARGQVFTEAFADCDYVSEKESFVNRFNEIKYDVESPFYADKHQEIYEGDTQWWNLCIQKNVKPTHKILDIGCGDGFVAQTFISSGIDFKTFVCMDVSDNILNQAKKKIGNDARFYFTNDIAQIRDKFDIITVSSVFHHVAYPEKFAATIDKLLETNGIIIGSHEPNQQVFNNKLFYLGAALYKLIGGGISINKKTVDQFNDLLLKKYPDAPSVCREEILQMVEYNSPLEQYDKGIDIQSGFIPDEFFKSCFPGYEILALQTYTTFYHRPWLAKHKNIRLVLGSVFNLFFKEGNLFRFVLKKI